MGRAIDAPTSNVDREEVPKDLPDLDKIHHVQPPAPPRPPRPASGSPGASAGGLSASAYSQSGLSGTAFPGPAADAPASAARAASAPATAAAPVAAAAPPSKTAAAPSKTAVGTADPEEKGTDEAPSNLHTVTAPPTRASSVRTGQPPLRAAMQLRHIDPWTTFKLSLVVSVVLFFVWMIAVGALYVVLSGMGVWARVNESMSTLVNEQEGASLVTAGDVFWWAGLVGLANVVLMTGIFTVGSFIYNLCAELVGGIQVTLGDRD